MIIKGINDKKTFKEFRENNPDFIIPLIYDVIGRNVFKKNKKLLQLVINNVLDTNFKLEDITIKDGKVKRKWKKESEYEVLVGIGRHVLNVEIYKKNTSVKDNKNRSYLENLDNDYYDYKICQININDYDIFKKGDEIYISTLKELKKGYERLGNLKIYDLNVGIFKERNYNNNERYDKDFISLMKIFESKSRKEIEEEIKDSILLKDVYKMQDKLNKKKFVLERFPNDLLYELERRELKENLEKIIKEADKEIENAKKEAKQEIINKMLEKGMSKEEILNLLDYNIDEINL